MPRFSPFVRQVVDLWDAIRADSASAGSGRSADRCDAVRARRAWARRVLARSRSARSFLGRSRAISLGDARLAAAIAACGRRELLRGLRAERLAERSLSAVALALRCRSVLARSTALELLALLDGAAIELPHGVEPRWAAEIERDLAAARGRLTAYFELGHRPSAQDFGARFMARLGRLSQLRANMDAAVARSRTAETQLLVLTHQARAARGAASGSWRARVLRASVQRVLQLGIGLRDSRMRACLGLRAEILAAQPELETAAAKLAWSVCEASAVHEPELRVVLLTHRPRLALRGQLESFLDGARVMQVVVPRSRALDRAALGCLAEADLVIDLGALGIGRRLDLLRQGGQGNAAWVELPRHSSVAGLFHVLELELAGAFGLALQGAGPRA